MAPLCSVSAVEWYARGCYFKIFLCFIFTNMYLFLYTHTHTYPIVYIKSYVQIELNGSRKYEIFHKALLGNQTLALDSDVDLAGFKK